MMKRSLFLVLTALMMLAMLALPERVEGQIYKKVKQADIDSPGWTWAGTYVIAANYRILTGHPHVGATYAGSAPVNVHSDGTITYIEGNYKDYEVTISSLSDHGKIYHNKDGYLKDPKKPGELTFNKTDGTDFQFSADGLLSLSSISSYIRLVDHTNFVISVSVLDYKGCLYKKQPATKEITGAGETGDNDKYYLIASPVSNYAPTVANGFLREDGYYDLYAFDHGLSEEWRNYKNGGFNLQSGIGYLYANKDNTTLSFDGTFCSGHYVYHGFVYGTYEVYLTYFPDQRLAGWNLLGNPFDVTAYIQGGRDFLEMNADGDGFIPNVDAAIDPMQGIFVQAAYYGEPVVFTMTAPSRDDIKQRVILNVIGSNGNIIDRAIVRFGDGGTLSKLTLNENSTKIYIPQYDGDYAVVRSNGRGDVPVNFKASEMGQYTISVETEGLDIHYLHLVDQLTGQDIDLLKDGKYSFVASTSDSESRFILKFNAPFAYQNGNDIIVSGEGELQVFDVMGRVVMKRQINGVETCHGASLQTGVYIFKMDGRTQKIVVR